jgi:superfamily II DNA or RNA helicase
MDKEIDKEKDKEKEKEKEKDKHIIEGSYLSKRGYVIKKESLGTFELKELKQKLIARPLTDSKFIANINNNDTSFPVYIETKNKIYIPKMYGIKNYGDPKQYLPNYIGKEWENEIKFKGNLLERQIEPVNLLLQACKEKGGGILSLMTGFGKTFCALYALSKLKMKAIVVVNKIPLMKQWQNEIATFLPDAKVGIIQGQKNIDVEDKDIVIAMLQSLSRIDYPDTLFKDFSVSVFDEIHNISSKMFSKVLFKLCSKYTIGLSATPNRSDGCEYVFKWHVGEIVYKGHTERKGKNPIIRNLKIDSKDYKEISTMNRFTGQNTIQFTSMLSDLVQMPKRNLLIVEIIKDIIKGKHGERKILVLSDRRSHLDILYNLLEQDLSVSFTYGLFVGSMKIAELEKSKACDVILATYAAFKEGVSEKDLNTLILTTPKKFIGHLKNTIKKESGGMEQIVGRIFRKDHIDLEPIIIDFQDNFSVYKTQSAGRRNFYKQHFKNSILENQSINLDEHEDVKIEYIKNNKKTEIIEKNKELENNIVNQLNTFCILE